MTNSTDRFLKIESRTGLASFLGVKKQELDYICRLRQPTKLYTAFTIPKKAGGTRTICAPNRQLKYIQNKLNKVLTELYVPKTTAHGYIKGKNIITNSKVHVGNRQILNLDIADFFPSIHFGRVRGLFEKPPFNFNSFISRDLAQIVCFKGSLPQGAPTSPIISNFICRSLDNQLKKFCKNYKVVCTRYCDDITISTPAKNFPAAIVSQDGILGAELIALFNQNNFKLNTDKIRLKSCGERKMVTGIVVNEKVNLTQKTYRNFRAQIYYTYINGLEEGAKKNNYFVDGKPDTERYERYIIGKLNYFKMVFGVWNSKYQYLAQKANIILEKNIFPIPDSFETYVEKNIFIIDEVSSASQGTAFLIKDIGLVTCLHNVCDIKNPINKQLLTDILNRNVKIYLPDNPNRTYLFTLKNFYYNEDLLILQPIGISKSGGLEFEKELPKIGKTSYFAAGYPNYSTNRTIDWLYDIKIRSRMVRCKQELFIVDKQFITGSSGGPVFNKNKKVIGYIRPRR